MMLSIIFFQTSSTDIFRMHFALKNGTGHRYLLQANLQALEVTFVTHGYRGRQYFAEEPVMHTVFFFRNVERCKIPELWHTTPSLDAIREDISLRGHEQQSMILCRCASENEAAILFIWISSSDVPTRHTA